MRRGRDVGSFARRVSFLFLPLSFSSFSSIPCFPNQSSPSPCLPADILLSKPRDRVGESSFQSFLSLFFPFRLVPFKPSSPLDLLSTLSQSVCRTPTAFLTKCFEEGRVAWSMRCVFPSTLFFLSRTSKTRPPLDFLSRIFNHALILYTTSRADHSEEGQRSSPPLPCGGNTTRLVLFSRFVGREQKGEAVLVWREEKGIWFLSTGLSALNKKREGRNSLAIGARGGPADSHCRAGDTTDVERTSLESVVLMRRDAVGWRCSRKLLIHLDLSLVSSLWTQSSSRRGARRVERRTSSCSRRR